MFGAFEEFFTQWGNIFIKGSWSIHKICLYTTLFLKHIWWIDIMIQVPEEKLSVIGEIVQMLHNASLLIDDIGILSKIIFTIESEKLSTRGGHFWTDGTILNTLSLTG